MNSTIFLIFTFAVGLMLVVIAAKFLALPFKILIKLVVNGLIGGVLLAAINFLGKYIGLHIGINIATSLIAGVLGAPGIALLLLLQIFF